MRLATVLTPITDQSLRWAAQCGVEDLVLRYPGDDPESLPRELARAAEYDLRASVVEGYLPIERIKLGEDDGRDLAALVRLIRQMGECGVPILCYNFMAGTDWVRTRLDSPERGGSWVTAFDLADVGRASLLSREAQDTPVTAPPATVASVTSEQLWERLERLLAALLPEAERAGVTLAMHPDDPPLPELLGRARIMHNVEGFERLLRLSPSPANKICFCQGAFATMGVDIPATIRRLGPGIAYVHFRDVRGTPERFVETWHDNGPTDMAAAIRVYRELGFDGPLRPDHVPQLTGEEEGEPGYTMLGRLFAYGYIRGLLDATR